MIPVAAPLLGDKELEYVADCIRSGWISSAGEYVRRFEREFAAYCGVNYGVATHNGTVALHLVLAALGIGPGDEVILPSLTFVATANAVTYTGATPVLVDSEPATWNIDPAAAAQAITPRTRAIIPVHLYGHPADMDPLRALADEHDLTLVEDAAESHGARYKGRRTGSLGDAAIFSFYGNKIITTGEGGMIVTDDAALAERCFFLENQAKQPDNPYWHTEVGYNYRMTNVQAAIGLAQLEEIDRFIALKQKMAAAYRRGLAGIAGLTLPEEKAWARSVYWMYAVVVEDGFGMSRDALAAALKQAGVDTRTFFIPVHRQPLYAKDKDYRGVRCPVSDELGEKGFYLPSGLALTAAQIKAVCAAIKALKP